MTQETTTEIRQRRRVLHEIRIIGNADSYNGTHRMRFSAMPCKHMLKISR
jgi:hypothetical protein